MFINPSANIRRRLFTRILLLHKVKYIHKQGRVNSFIREFVRKQSFLLSVFCDLVPAIHIP